MVVAGYVVELVFGGARPDPAPAPTRWSHGGESPWNYTTWLNIAFLLLAIALLIRFFRTGGRGMLRMMGGTPGSGQDHDSGGHQEQPNIHDAERGEQPGSP